MAGRIWAGRLLRAALAHLILPLISSTSLRKSILLFRSLLSRALFNGLSLGCFRELLKDHFLVVCQRVTILFLSRNFDWFLIGVILIILECVWIEILAIFGGILEIHPLVVSLFQLLCLSLDLLTHILVFDTFISYRTSQNSWLRSKIVLLPNILLRRKIGTISGQVLIDIAILNKVVQLHKRFRLESSPSLICQDLRILVFASGVALSRSNFLRKFLDELEFIERSSQNIAVTLLSKNLFFFSFDLQFLIMINLAHICRL